MSTLRHLEAWDHHTVLQVVNDWWGGRQVASLLPKLFFEHFRPTSFVIEEDDTLQAFLVGFRSQTTPSLAYIHFVGVHPRQRGQGTGRRLYEHFFHVASALGCTEVCCITSPVNRVSIAFHTSMGFEILPGDTLVDGIEATSDYDGAGESRVLFRRYL